LNEATVAGLRPGPDGSVVLLLNVLALPETGPVDPDGRRALILSGVSRTRVLLRRCSTWGDPARNPAIPLRDFEAVEEFFASISLSGDMYGWEFLDSSDLIDDWPPVVSLDLSSGAAPSAHSLYWFNECGLFNGYDGYVPYRIEGVVDFQELTVERFDGTPVAVEEFVAAGKRWWQALFGQDPRVSVAAQTALGEPPPWRAGVGSTDVIRSDVSIEKWPP
jgi:hypothetical protein